MRVIGIFDSGISVSETDLPMIPQHLLNECNITFISKGLYALIGDRDTLYKILHNLSLDQNIRLV